MTLRQKLLREAKKKRELPSVSKLKLLPQFVPQLSTIMPATERQCNFSMDIDLKELYNKVKKSRQTYIPADLTDLMSKQSLTESIETMDPTT